MAVAGIPLTIAIIGLALAAITVLAFWQPAVYARFFPYLVVAVGVVYLICFFWNMALLQGENVVIESIGSMKENNSKLAAILAASRALQAIQFPFGWMSVILVCATSYIGLLRLVPAVREAARTSAAG
ncbi:MAG TPA: hypothetical protein VGK90_12030 [Rhizomicrobium sp.]|jgi:hypothetical protein